MGGWVGDIYVCAIDTAVAVCKCMCKHVHAYVSGHVGVGVREKILSTAFSLINK